MAERLKAAVSKTVIGSCPIVGSNPTLSATLSRPAIVLMTSVALRGRASSQAPFPVFRQFTRPVDLRPELPAPEFGAGC